MVVLLLGLIEFQESSVVGHVKGSKFVNECVEEFVYSLQTKLENLDFLPLDDESGPQGVGDLVHCFQVSIQLVIDG